MRAPGSSRGTAIQCSPCPGQLLTLRGRWQRTALEQAVPSSAEREEIKRLRADLKRVETERDILCLSRRGLRLEEVKIEGE